MEPSSFFLVYVFIFIGCVLLTLGVIWVVRPGIKKYFESIFKDQEVAYFFYRIFSLVLFLSGLSAALVNPYKMDDKSNWLTLSWDATGQVRSTLSSLYDGLLAFTIVFLILHVVNRIFAK